MKLKLVLLKNKSDLSLSFVFNTHTKPTEFIPKICKFVCGIVCTKRIVYTLPRLEK